MRLRNSAVILFAVSMLLVACGSSDQEKPVTSGEASEMEELEIPKAVNTEKLEYTCGQWNGNIFESEYLDLSFVMPDGWSNEGEDELRQAAQGQSLYSLEFVARKPEEGMMIQMFVNQDIPMDAEQFLEYNRERMKADQKVEYTIGDITTATIAGQEFLLMPSSSKAQNGTPLQQLNMARKQDDNVIGIGIQYIPMPSQQEYIDNILKNNFLSYGEAENSAAASEPRWDGGVFQCAAMGISVALPENWDTHSAPELSFTMGRKIGGDITQQETVYHTIITKTGDNGNSILQLLTENLVLSGSPVDETEYLRSIQPMMEEDLSATAGEIITKSIAGQEYYLLPLSYSMNDINMIQWSLVRHEGDYMQVISFIFPEDSMEEIEGILQNNIMPYGNE